MNETTKTPAPTTTTAHEKPVANPKNWIRVRTKIKAGTTIVASMRD